MGPRQHIEDPDIVLIGSGIMSATLGAILRCLDPTLRVQMVEATEELAQESSNGWNNAGTGHAGICELSYTPHANPDGSVPIEKAVEIFEQFELSRQFWAYAAERGMIRDPHGCIRPVPHVSFVHGEEQVRFLRARHDAMSRHHFFREMEYSEDREQIAEWAPLLVEGRGAMPVAATRMEGGTDVNFGRIATDLSLWLSEQEGCAVATACRVTGLKKVGGRWRLRLNDLKTGGSRTLETPKVFVGAGGGSLLLLQQSGIDEARGYGGFPVGGQWLVCDNPEVVARHNAKVYGQAQAEAPTMAVPHLDRRVIDGEDALLFGPFASWTTKFLHRRGSVTDLPRSVRLDNLWTLIKTGLCNLGLVQYLVKEGLQSKRSRVNLLRRFYPEAREEDWRVVDAGIRVQAIKGAAGIVHYGTEVVADADRTISALLGASPGASVCVAVMLDVVESLTPELVAQRGEGSAIASICPSYGIDLKPDKAADLYQELSEAATRGLALNEPTPVG